MHAYHCRRACFRVLHILFLFDLGGRGPGGGHHKNDNIITFWCNSSGTHVTTFTLDYCDIVPCPFDPSWWCHWYSDIPDGKDIYVCHTDSYWGQSCGFCGGQWVGTQGQTGRPQSALDKKDENRKPHILTKDTPDTYTDPAHSQRRKRAALSGSFDPHVYIDAIGVPRGVPDEFKARDQVAAGFESLIPIITVNKNRLDKLHIL